MTPAEKAAILQEEGFLKDIADAVQRRLYNQWLGTHETDTDRREALWREAQATEAGIQQIARMAQEHKRGLLNDAE